MTSSQSEELEVANAEIRSLAASADAMDADYANLHEENSQLKDELEALQSKISDTDFGIKGIVQDLESLRSEL